MAEIVLPWHYKNVSKYLKAQSSSVRMAAAEAARSTSATSAPATSRCLPQTPQATSTSAHQGRIP